MMRKSKQVAQKKITHTKLNAIVETIRESIKEDPKLANALINFLDENGINISKIMKDKRGKELPVTFKEKDKANKMIRLRRAFADAEGDIF